MKAWIENIIGLAAIVVITYILNSNNQSYLTFGLGLLIGWFYLLLINAKLEKIEHRRNKRYDDHVSQFRHKFFQYRCPCGSQRNYQPIDEARKAMYKDGFDWDEVEEAFMKGSKKAYSELLAQCVIQWKDIEAVYMDDSKKASETCGELFMQGLITDDEYTHAESEAEYTALLAIGRSRLNEIKKEMYNEQK